MSRWRTAALSALAAALSVLVLAPGASAQDGTISIGGVTIVSDSVATETLTATGTGACASAGKVFIHVTVSDLDTDGSGAGSAVIECTAAGEHIRWTVGVVSNSVRAGDKASVSATAAGAIDAADKKVVTVKQLQ
jgi:hypothetical protein